MSPGCGTADIPGLYGTQMVPFAAAPRFCSTLLAHCSHPVMGAVRLYVPHWSVNLSQRSAGTPRPPSCFMTQPGNSPQLVTFPVTPGGGGTFGGPFGKSGFVFG